MRQRVPRDARTRSVTRSPILGGVRVDRRPADVGRLAIHAVVVEHDPRRVGRSNYTFSKLVTHAFNMMTGFSTLPLQLASLVGFAFTLFGVGVLVYVMGRYMIEGVAVPGFAFLASIIAIFSGAQLFALGIIGEYLARVFHRSTGQPSYTVRERTT